MLQNLETELKIRGFSKKTIKAYLDHNQKFLAFLKQNKKDTSSQTSLTEDSALNPKHNLLIEFLYSSGLRVSEAVSIKTDDLNWHEKLGKITSGKGNKDRNII